MQLLRKNGANFHTSVNNINNLIGIIWIGEKTKIDKMFYKHICCWERWIEKTKVN
jgi:hypothetical protein